MPKFAAVIATALKSVSVALSFGNGVNVVLPPFIVCRLLGLLLLDLLMLIDVVHVYVVVAVLFIGGT